MSSQGGQTAQQDNFESACCEAGGGLGPSYVTSLSSSATGRAVPLSTTALTASQVMIRPRRRWTVYLPYLGFGSPGGFAVLGLYIASQNCEALIGELQ